MVERKPSVLKANTLARMFEQTCPAEAPCNKLREKKLHENAVASSNSLRRRAFRLHDDSAHIVATSRANRVCGNRLAALGAEHRLFRRFGTMRAAFAGSRIGVFSFGDSHGNLISARVVHQSCNRIPEFRSRRLVCQPNRDHPSGLIQGHKEHKKHQKRQPSRSRASSLWGV